MQLAHSKLQVLGALAAMTLVAAFGSQARADVDLEGVLLLGTGVDTGKAPNNPYAMQFGGALELTVSGFVAGVRATRSVATDKACDLLNTDECDKRVRDLRTVGLDLGMDWELSLLHVSPRFGFGYLNEKDGDRAGTYLEPGGVAEVELGWFVAGADLRYRFAIREAEANGFLAYLRAGLRF